MKNFQNWPVWIPNPNALMSAVLLVLLIEGIKFFLEYIFPFEGLLIVLPPNLKLILYATTLLSPIIVVAIAHHWLNLVLDRFFPNITTSEMGKAEGILPGLISWWEGLYGCMAIYFSNIVILLVEIILNPDAINSEFYLMHDLLAWWDIIIGWFTIPNLVRLVTIAYLYQFDNVYRNHLMSLGAVSEIKKSDNESEE